MRIVGQFTFFEGECYHEKNISAEQDEKTENLWFSGSFQDQKRPGHPASQKSEGKKEISSLAFAKECRITKRPHFLECYDRGRRYFSANFILIVLERMENERSWRLGLAVSKKVGKAVRRNRIKRLIREFFRLHQDRISLPLDFVVIPKKAINADSLDFAQVERELAPLLRKIHARTRPVRPE